MVRLAMTIVVTAALAGCGIGWKFEAAMATQPSPTGCTPEILASPEACFECDLELIGVLSHRSHDTVSSAIVIQQAASKGADFLVGGPSSGGVTQNNSLIMNSSTLNAQVTSRTTLRWLLYRRTHFLNHTDPHTRPPWLTAQMACPPGQTLRCDDVSRTQRCDRMEAFNPNIHGLQIEWHSNGQKKAMYHYEDGLLHGETIDWWPNGQVKQRGRYHMYKSCGPQECWNEDGTVASCSPSQLQTCPVH